MTPSILRGVRVALPSGIQPASVHLRDGKIEAVAPYDEVPRGASCVELGKALLMPLVLPPTHRRAQPTSAGTPDLGSTLLALTNAWATARDENRGIDAFVAVLYSESRLVHAMSRGVPADLMIWHPERTDLDSGKFGSVERVLVAGKWCQLPSSTTS